MQRFETGLDVVFLFRDGFEVQRVSLDVDVRFGILPNRSARLSNHRLNLWSSFFQADIVIAWAVCRDIRRQSGR